ncbi:hypothetical protein SAY86_013353 [Trapa natans]|uniref:Uncharacterized protein n=1 Tax=Trapa natans TaxID=22666 RepID=A0AAN7M153_TRANT|nr:hypothetical protein SAY86_013353 [Trapa natans]
MLPVRSSGSIRCAPEPQEGQVVLISTAAPVMTIVPSSDVNRGNLLFSGLLENLLSRESEQFRYIDFSFRLYIAQLGSHRTEYAAKYEIHKTSMIVGWESLPAILENAILYSLDKKVPRTGKLALRRAIPANTNMKAIQARLLQAF